MKSLLICVAVIFGIFCLATGIYFYDEYQERKAYHIASVPIQIIAQSGSEKEALKTDYLAQLIGLAYDQSPKSFKEKIAQDRLLASPLIKDAKVKQVSPNVLSIDYSLRKPYVFLGDYENTALDRDGYPFPFSPFYTPKNIPCVYLGNNSLKWGVIIEEKQLAFEMLSYLEKKIDFFNIKLLDVTQAEFPSLGRREVVLVIQGKYGDHTLRLTPTDYVDQLNRYFLLDYKEGNQIIDLRVPNLAFIKRNGYD